MSIHNDLGKKGEEKAIEYLLSKGYAIVEKNWVSGHKEVDIIAKINNILVIVEVKTRQVPVLVAPEFAVDSYKQRNLIWAAEAYVRMKKLNCDVRFDIVSIIVDKKGNFLIDHLENAFYPKLQMLRY